MTTLFEDTTAKLAFLKKYKLASPVAACQGRIHHF